MNMISRVLFYWITILLALVFAKFTGIADNTTALVILLVIVTILYFITTRRQLSNIRKENGDAADKSAKKYNGSSRGRKKKAGHK